MTRVMCVTGTDTDIGKTIATAAIAAIAWMRGERVLVVKPTQTGVDSGDDSDIDVVTRLAGEVDTAEFVRLPEPLAPDEAARRAGVSLPTVAEHATRVAVLATSGDYDLILVEGAGGLLVRLDLEGATLADLALHLRAAQIDAQFVVVCRENLGTLNHTALTLEALRNRELPLAGVIVGAVSTQPDLASATNIAQLHDLAGGRFLGGIPSGAGKLTADEFQSAAPNWLRLPS